MINFKKWFTKPPPPADPPTNVRIVWSDIGEEPVDCIYKGWDGEAHNWLVQNRSAISRTHFPVNLLTEKMPAKTSIIFEGDMTI